MRTTMPSFPKMTGGVSEWFVTVSKLRIPWKWGGLAWVLSPYFIWQVNIHPVYFQAFCGSVHIEPFAMLAWRAYLKKALLQKKRGFSWKIKTRFLFTAATACCRLCSIFKSGRICFCIKRKSSAHCCIFQERNRNCAICYVFFFPQLVEDSITI